MIPSINRSQRVDLPTSHSQTTTQPQRNSAVNRPVVVIDESFMNEWGPFESIVNNLKAESLRFTDPTRTFEVEWERYKESKTEDLKTELMARTLFMRILSEGSCAWSKILACAYELGDSQGAEKWIQSVYLIFEDPRLPQPTEAEKIKFQDLFKQFQPQTLDQVIVNWMLVTHDANIERRFVSFTHLISRETAEEVFRSINITNFTQRDMRLIMMLLVNLDPQFWEDKKTELSTLANNSNKKRGPEIHRLDRVFLNELLVKCLIRNIGNDEEVWTKFRNDEPFVISASIHLLYLMDDSLRPKDIVQLIGITQSPLDLNVIARIINAHYQKWDESGFHLVMNNALMKDHLIFQLSPEVTTRYFGNDLFKCFKELDIPEIEKLVEKSVKQLASLKKHKSTSILLKVALLVRYLEVYAEYNSRIKEIYCGFFAKTNKNNIATLCWNLDYSSDLERPISDFLMRRFARESKDSRGTNFMVAAISIRNNYIGSRVFQTKLGVVVTLREALNGLEWHQNNVELVKEIFTGADFFTYLIKVNLYHQALEVYATLFSLPGWLAKFTTSIITVKGAGFHPESWDFLEKLLLKESWSIADVNEAGSVNAHLIRLMEITEKHPRVLESSTSEDLLDWIDSILRCKEGTPEDWKRVEELLKSIQSKLKSPVKKAAAKGKRNGRGKGVQKSVDPFTMKWSLLSDHIKKMSDSEEHIHALIAQRRKETVANLTMMKNASAESLAAEQAKIWDELKKTDSETSEDTILESFNVAKKTALKMILDLHENMKQDVISLYENKVKHLENDLNVQGKEKKLVTVSKSLLKSQKDVMASIDSAYQSIQEKVKVNIQFQLEAIAKAAKQRDLDLRKRALLNGPEMTLEVDSYQKIIEIENQHFEELKQRRVEKINTAKSEEEIERIQAVFNQKVQEIKGRCHHKLGRLAKVNKADDREELFKKRIRELELENLKIRRELERSEEQIREFREAATIARVPVDVVDKISNKNLVELLESLSSKFKNVKKMIKMIQQQGSVLAKVEDLYLFLEHAGFVRVDENGGSHRTFAGPNDTKITLANHHTDSTQAEIESVIEVVYRAFQH